MLFGVELELWLTCILVVLGRLVDVSLGCVRTVLTVKNKPVYASLVGFVEVFVWFLIVNAAMSYVLKDPVTETLILAVVYSFGFALGTYLGGLLVKKFVKTKVTIEAVLSSKNNELVEALRKNGFGQTILSAYGSNGKKETYLIKIETDQKNLQVVKDLINTYDKDAFLSVHEIQEVVGGFFGNSK